MTCSTVYITWLHANVVNMASVADFSVVLNVVVVAKNIGNMTQILNVPVMSFGQGRNILWMFLKILYVVCFQSFLSYGINNVLVYVTMVRVANVVEKNVLTGTYNLHVR